jgi:opacity protein-like surface antigen
VRLSDQFSARVRFGYAAGKTLLYATGGYARTSAMVSAIDSFTNPGGPAAACAPAPCQANLGPEGPVVTTASERHSLSGWTAGAGIEQKLSKLLSIGLEYRHTDFGGHNFALANGTTVNTGPVTIGDNGQPGLLGSVSGGATRIKLQSDALSLRIALHF